MEAAKSQANEDFRRRSWVDAGTGWIAASCMSVTVQTNNPTLLIFRPEYGVMEWRSNSTTVAT